MTALQPPILNLNKLSISSGWPSDFRMSMVRQVCSSYSDKLMYEPGEMFPIKAMRCREEEAATRRRYRRHQRRQID